ncbi:nucleotide-binding protein [Clostridioides difficile]|nr:nucleotide-binding protein [Clostridioides difficile]
MFIVHGHDNGLKNEVARFLEKLKLKPIILHEQASEGETIIEKIERYSNVGFGIVLYTPCDKGGLANDGAELRCRARQNVVFEHGYLIGKLERKNVCALVKDDVEKPNDISGVVYVSYDESGAWKIEIAKELKAAGYNIDFNKLF